MQKRDLTPYDIHIVMAAMLWNDGPDFSKVEMWAAELRGEWRISNMT